MTNSTTLAASIRATEMIAEFGKVGALAECQNQIAQTGVMGRRFYWQTVHTYIDPTISAAPSLVEGANHGKGWSA